MFSGTVFESSKLALPERFLAMHLMTQAKDHVSALELKRHLDVSYPTAWLLKQRMMQVMVDREQWRRLIGKVEIDDDPRAILARLARLAWAASQVTPCPLSKVRADSGPSKC